MDIEMFGISYTTWHDICSIYFSLPEKTQKSYLQWFPFSKLSERDKKTIISKSFFDMYISTGGFLLFPEVMRHSDNYIQKGDGSFRNATLISPLLYLVFQAIGKEISIRYTPERPQDIEVYYAGNYELLRSTYKKDYDDFYKAINAGAERYRYFIKTDITNFFGHININELVSRINFVCNKGKQTISQTQLLLIKELLLYSGNGNYPLIENSLVSSYMATVIYLDEIDSELHDFISRYTTDISEFKMIRYVDDLYILFSSEKELDDLTQTYNAVKNAYSSILKNHGLSLNVAKCSFKEIDNVNEDLKKSLYDEYINGIENEIGELFTGTLKGFLGDVYTLVGKHGITTEQYYRLIEEHFSFDGIEFTASEVYNYLVYENQNELKSPAISGLLVKIINTDISFLSIDPKRLAVMVMQSGNDKAVKAMLNQLFIRERSNLWNSYDTTIAIAYLIQSKFQHIDLLSTLYKYDPDLYAYYWHCCRVSFLNQVNDEKWNRYLRCVSNDKKAIFLYFMSNCERNRSNHLGAYAYYKNFFDRISADMAHMTGADNGCKKANYKKYYTEKAFKGLYSGIKNYDFIIENAHKIRNENPLSHSSAGLIDSNNSSNDLRTTSEQLDYLIDHYSKINGL